MSSWRIFRPWIALVLAFAEESKNSKCLETRYGQLQQNLCHGCLCLLKREIRGRRIFNLNAFGQQITLQLGYFGAAIFNVVSNLWERRILGILINFPSQSFGYFSVIFEIIFWKTVVKPNRKQSGFVTRDLVSLQDYRSCDKCRAIFPRSFHKLFQLLFADESKSEKGFQWLQIPP